jgi:hypothetical protein
VGVEILTKENPMKAFLSILAGALLLTSAATADDHLFQAQQHGLADNAHSQAIAHSEEAPGQGSPFTGEHQCSPATATEAAQLHANVMPKGPDAGECLAEEED